MPEQLLHGDEIDIVIQAIASAGVSTSVGIRTATGVARTSAAVVHGVW